MENLLSLHRYVLGHLKKLITENRFPWHRLHSTYSSCKLNPGFGSWFPTKTDWHHFLHMRYQYNWLWEGECSYQRIICCHCRDSLISRLKSFLIWKLHSLSSNDLLLIRCPSHFEALAHSCIFPLSAIFLRSASACSSLLSNLFWLCAFSATKYKTSLLVNDISCP